MSISEQQRNLSEYNIWRYLLCSRFRYNAVPHGIEHTTAVIEEAQLKLPQNF